MNPTHYAHVIAQLLQEPLPVPVVWNTGGYDKVETLRALESKIDIYLPDLKYMQADPAGRYSNAPDYPEVAKAAILEMFRQTGPLPLWGGRAAEEGGHHPTSGAAGPAGGGQSGDGLGEKHLCPGGSALLP